MRRAVQLLLLGLFVFTSAQAIALMPPHVNSAEPPNEGILYGDMLILRGNTLEYAKDSKLKVTLVNSGKVVPISSHLDCKQVGKCGKDYRPGSCQSSCTLAVTLEEVTPGARYEVRFLRWKSQFRAATQEEQKAHDEKRDPPKKDEPKGEKK